MPAQKRSHDASDDDPVEDNAGDLSEDPKPVAEDDGDRGSLVFFPRRETVFIFLPFLLIIVRCFSVDFGSADSRLVRWLFTASLRRVRSKPFLGVGEQWKYQRRVSFLFLFPLHLLLLLIVSVVCVWWMCVVGSVVLNFDFRSSMFILPFVQQEQTFFILFYLIYINITRRSCVIIYIFCQYGFVLSRILGSMSLVLNSESSIVAFKYAWTFHAIFLSCDQFLIQRHQVFFYRISIEFLVEDRRHWLFSSQFYEYIFFYWYYKSFV